MRIEPTSCAVPTPLTAQVTLGSGLPSTVRLELAIPPVGTLTEFGETEICGGSAVLERISALSELEIADPGFGFVTVTCTLPTSEAVAMPLAVSSVAETKFVASAVLPKFTTAPATNEPPETVIVNEPTFN